jgi:integrase
MAPRQRAPRGAPEPSWSETRREWQVRIELPAGPDKPRNRKWIRAKTKEECQEKLRRAQMGLADYRVVPKDNITVGQVAEEWLDSIRPQVSRGTLRAYQNRVHAHIIPELGSRRLTSLTVADVDAWQQRLERKGLAVTTRREIRTCLVTLIKWAVKHDYVVRNVAALSSGPKGRPKPVESLSKTQAKAVLEAVKGWRYEAAVVLMMTAGLRIGETLGLRWIDVTDSSVTIAGTLATRPSLHYQPEPKTAESRRTVALSQLAQEALQAHREHQELERTRLGLGPAQFVFLTATHQRLVDPSILAQELKTQTYSLGLHIHPHKLRHTAVSLMLDAGVPLETVSKVVGHRSIRTTADLYQSLLDGGRTAAASAMDEALG